MNNSNAAFKLKKITRLNSLANKVKGIYSPLIYLQIEMALPLPACRRLKD